MHSKMRCAKCRQFLQASISWLGSYRDVNECLECLWSFAWGASFKALILDQLYIILNIGTLITHTGYVFCTLINSADCSTQQKHSTMSHRRYIAGWRSCLKTHSAFLVLCVGKTLVDYLHTGKVCGALIFCYLKQAVKQTFEFPVIWESTTLMLRHCNIWYYFMLNCCIFRVYIPL